MLNPTRLLLDLQHVNEIAQRISGALDATYIAHQVTDGLIEQFGCAFTRIWLIEADRQYLKLVASSGLYTHTNGSFARVPMGAYKVGKIAQNRVPFLSNQLAEEPWVKDRNWAIANNIKGFAGYPLAVGDRVIGVLATFSHQSMAPEFLEMLQVLCMTATIALDAAIQAQQSQQQHLPHSQALTHGVPSLSDQISAVLVSTRLMLLGTEHLLPPSTTHAFLRLAEILEMLQCSYCRLTYREADVMLEAIATLDPAQHPKHPGWIEGLFKDVEFLVVCLGGIFQCHIGEHRDIIQIELTLPSGNSTERVSPVLKVTIRCVQPVIQIALMHLATLAGLDVSGSHRERNADITITDDETVLNQSMQPIWVRHPSKHAVPSKAKAVIDLSIQPAELKHLVAQVSQGAILDKEENRSAQSFSEREQEIMQLLAEGLRDRDIAKKLFISESTVKFHINNSLTKLNAKNRYQGVYQAAMQGWI